jgi:hypothetical protein
MRAYNWLSCFKVTANNFCSTPEPMKFRRNENVNAAGLKMCDITDENG